MTSLEAQIEKDSSKIDYDQIKKTVDEALASVKALNETISKGGDKIIVEQAEKYNISEFGKPIKYKKPEPRPYRRAHYVHDRNGKLINKYIYYK